VERSVLSCFKAPSVQMHGEPEKTVRTVGIVDSHVAVNRRKVPNTNQTFQVIMDLFSVGRAGGQVGARIWVQLSIYLGSRSG